MARLFLQWVILLVLGASSSTLAQPDFKATPTTIVMAEGGRESILLVETDHERFSLSIPKGYGMDARAETRSIIFTAGAGASVISVQFTTNYAGALPKHNNLPPITLELPWCHPRPLARPSPSIFSYPQATASCCASATRTLPIPKAVLN
jgi:hypothetical protein